MDSILRGSLVLVAVILASVLWVMGGVPTNEAGEVTGEAWLDLPFFPAWLDRLFIPSGILILTLITLIMPGITLKKAKDWFTRRTRADGFNKIQYTPPDKVKQLLIEREVKLQGMNADISPKGEITTKGVQEVDRKTYDKLDGKRRVVFLFHILDGNRAGQMRLIDAPLMHGTDAIYNGDYVDIEANDILKYVPDDKYPLESGTGSPDWAQLYLDSIKRNDNIAPPMTGSNFQQPSTTVVVERSPREEFERRANNGPSKDSRVIDLKREEEEYNE